MDLKILTNRIAKSKQLIYIVILFFVFLLPYLIKSLLNDCKYNLLHAYVRNPNGQYIQKYNNEIKLKTFGELTRHCRNGNLKSPCFNVKHKGETMHRQMQLGLLRMLHIVHQVCIRHNITYWLMKGTLLGAYRDSLMVRWDDDADVGMTLQDFEKFDKIIRNYLPKDISFQPKSEDIYSKTIRRYPWAKMRDERTCYTHCIRNKGCRIKDGAQLDFFVFRMFDEGGNNPYIFDETQLVVPKCQPTRNIPWKYIVPLQNISFEGMQLFAPNNIVGTLSYTYGNLRKPFGECPNHYIAVPWASCQEISEMNEHEQADLLYQLII